MKVLVTGASGFLGSHVVRSCVKSGMEVRALVRKTSSLHNLKELPIQIFHGDILSGEDLRKALQGCSWLFHTAADYRFTSLEGNKVLETNVRGTQMVLEAAKKSNVERMVYTSSTATIGIPENGAPGNEETPLREKDLVGPYKKSKFYAEIEVKKAVKEGLPVVIVNPSTPVGTHDSKPTPTGKFIVDFLNRKLFAYTNTGLNLVDAEDVAEGHLLAAKKGRIGERYILGNQNMDFRSILEILSALTGIPVPKIRLPYSAILFMAYVNHAFSALMLKREPGIPLEGVKLSRKKMFFDASKARRELGLPQTEISAALGKAVTWYRENAYAPG